MPEPDSRAREARERIARWLATPEADRDPADFDRLVELALGHAAETTYGDLGGLPGGSRGDAGPLSVERLEELTRDSVRTFLDRLDPADPAGADPARLFAWASSHVKYARVQARIDAWRAAADDAARDRARDELLALVLDRFAALVRDRLPHGDRAFGASDVAQEAYLALRKSLRAERTATVNEFFAYTGLKLERLFLDHLRKAARAPGPLPRVPKSSDAGGGDTTFEPAAPGPPPPTDGLTETLERALKSLNDDEREVYRHHFINGLSQKQTAEQLGVSPDTVKRRWASVRIKLGRWFRGFGDDA